MSTDIDRHSGVYRSASQAELKRFLDALVVRYHTPALLESDPLEFPKRYQDSLDQEAVGLVSALLAYGNVKQIRRSVSDVLERLATTGLTPSEWVRSLETGSGRRQGAQTLDGFVHRFNRGEDLVLLLRLLARSWRLYGSLGAHLGQYASPSQADLGPALDGLIHDWRLWAGRDMTPSFSYLLTAPKDGSVCKRWCMLLRWMVRKDELDLGLWNVLRPDQLVMPIDTHTGRISQYLGLTGRKSLNWKAALEITQSLKKLNPEDPTRYDFALSRLGILNLCRKSFRVEICSKCGLLPVCQYANQRPR